MNMIRSEYSEVKDYFIKWCIILCIVAVILLAFFSYIFSIKPLPLLLLVIPLCLLIYFFANRRCKNCNNKMVRVTSSDRSVTYCCDECKTKITLKVNYSDSAS